MTHNADSSSPASPASSPAQRPPRLALLIATGFGLGYLPKAPGTWGSLGGVVVAFLILNFWFFLAFWNHGETSHLGLIHQALFGPSQDVLARSPEFFFVAPYLMLMVVVGWLGAHAAGRTAKHVGRSDPGTIVVDEISGQLVSFLGVLDLMPVGWKYLLAGFILFRVFDIWKPWPVRAAEKLPGGWGIMADDWVAGIYAALCLWALRAVGL
jgi:phosphatidylglycerophosphatase A